MAQEAKTMCEKILRGALIVFEGCDRSGKTTQCTKLVSALEKRNIKAKYVNFPDRSTPIGQIIHQYLVSEVNLPDEVIHLLFSANRWEMAESIRQQLAQGTTFVVDRYVFSGIAFSAAKGLSLDWCKSSDVGLPKPDKVFLLTLSPEAQAKRKGFGEERYEVSEFQQKVTAGFLQLQDDSWEVVDAERSPEDLHGYFLENTISISQALASEHIPSLWK